MIIETIDIVGVGFVGIGIVLFVALGIRLLMSYQRTEKKQTFYLSGEFIFGGLGMLFLLLEQVALLLYAESEVIPPRQTIFEYTEINVFFVAFICAALAWLCSGTAIIAANFFTHSFFPESSKKLLGIPIGLILVYLALILTASFEWVGEPGDWSPEHLSELNVVLWILFFIPLWIVVFLFFYLTISLYRRGSPAWRRLFWIFISQTLLSLAFTIEILNPATLTGILTLLQGYEGYIAAISRFFLMIYPVLMWIGVLTPNWAKGMLGVTS